MKKIIFLSLTLLCLASCKKKKECLQHRSDELWLIIEDSSGTNLIDSKYPMTPVAFSAIDQTDGGSRVTFEKVVTNSGIEDQAAWKVDLDKMRPNQEYSLSTGAAVFSLELEWIAQDPECTYRKYTGRKLNWIRFQDSTFYGSGTHTYIKY